MRFKRVYVEITNICNLSCDFCKPSSRDKKFILVKDFENIINKIKKYTEYIYLHVLGEPLLHPNIKEILDICYKNNMKVNITTNGTLINNVEDILLNSKAIRQINFSLHALEVNKNINSENYLNRILDFTKKANKNIFIVYRLWNFDKSNNLNRYILDNIQKYFNLEDLSLDKTTGNGIKISNNTFLQKNNSFIWPSINGKEIFFEGRCFLNFPTLGILVDGTVIPCCLDAEGVLNLGNIFKQDIDEILNSNKYKELEEGFRKNKVVNSYCRTCGFTMSKR